jgi:hypothetical protein
MSILRFIPWKALAGMAPELINALRKRHTEGQHESLAALRGQLEALERELAAVARTQKAIMAGLIVLSALSLAALVIGIVLLAG